MPKTGLIPYRTQCHWKLFLTASRDVPAPFIFSKLTWSCFFCLDSDSLTSIVGVRTTHSFYRYLPRISSVREDATDEKEHLQVDAVNDMTITDWLHYRYTRNFLVKASCSVSQCQRTGHSIAVLACWWLKCLAGFLSIPASIGTVNQSDLYHCRYTQYQSEWISLMMIFLRSFWTSRCICSMFFFLLFMLILRSSFSFFSLSVHHCRKNRQGRFASASMLLRLLTWYRFPAVSC